MKITASSKKVASPGHSLFTLRKPGDTKIMPTVSLQMETDIAQYLVRLVNTDQDIKKNIKIILTKL